MYCDMIHDNKIANSFKWIWTVINMITKIKQNVDGMKIAPVFILSIYEGQSKITESC